MARQDTQFLIASETTEQMDSVIWSVFLAFGDMMRVSIVFARNIHSGLKLPIIQLYFRDETLPRMCILPSSAGIHEAPICPRIVEDSAERFMNIARLNGRVSREQMQPFHGNWTFVIDGPEYTVDDVLTLCKHEWFRLPFSNRMRRWNHNRTAGNSQG